MEAIVEAKGKSKCNFLFAQQNGNGHDKSFEKGWLKNRYIVSVLGSLGMFIIYGSKVNLSVAMVRMVNHSAVYNKEDLTTMSNECGGGGAIPKEYFSEVSQLILSCQHKW